MTEAEWNRCTDPQMMLDFLWTSRRLSGRKLRLFFCARSRHIWDMLVQPEYRQAVEVAERFADATADENELREAYEQTRHAFWGAHPAVLGGNVLSEQTTAHLRLYVAILAANPRLGSIRPFWEQVSMVRERLPEEGNAECNLLRDNFGPLPFHPVTIAPILLSWNDNAVRKLAQAIYEKRSLPEGWLDTARLNVLADALEEAGCTDQEILSHCRSPSDHVRGCWLLDLILGKA